MKTNPLVSLFISVVAVAALAGCGQPKQAQAASDFTATSAGAVDLARTAADIRATDARWLATARTRVTTMNNGVVVWRKQPDGQWKAAVDIGTPAPMQPK